MHLRSLTMKVLSLHQQLPNFASVKVPMQWFHMLELARYVILEVLSQNELVPLWTLISCLYMSQSQGYDHLCNLR